MDDAKLLHYSLGTQIRRWRDKRGLNLNELHALSGVSQKTVRELEDGESIPKMTVLLKLVEALGCSIKIVVDSKDHKERNSIPKYYKSK